MSKFNLEIHHKQFRSQSGEKYEENLIQRALLATTLHITAETKKRFTPDASES
jgi:hypothetical protein